MNRKFIALILAVFVFASCQSDTQTKINSPKEVTIKEIFQTSRDENDNVDSPTIWHNPNGETWLIATAKTTDVLIVNNAETGEFIKRIGGTGIKKGEMKRPNGIAVIDSLAIVVERDNHRIQLFILPSFKSVGFIGEKDLIKPYGLYVYKKENVYNLFVTDNYETEDEQIPPPGELNKRVHQYKFTFDGKILKSEMVKTFGDTSGSGILSIVESVYGDTLYNNLLLSEEDTVQSSVKVYDLNGKFTGKVFGKGLFKFQVEGISLYECANGNGYWIITDQSMTENCFLLFDRKTFIYIGAFKGANTLNTDGIWLAQKPFGKFSRGAFYAVHNDGNVSAFDFGEIADSLKINLDCK